MDSKPVSQSPLTQAQLSRASAHAIRQCVHLHSLADAYFVLNSLRYSNFLHQKSRVKFTGVRSVDDFKNVALQFGRPVSPRLSSHTLLHGLLRVGLSKKVYKLTRLMIDDGIKVRSKTLEAVIGSLSPTNSTHFLPARPIDTIPRFRFGSAHDEGTRMALSLFELAQKSGHRRTRSMYKALLALCILNGEIILGSLLFGCMIRHWQGQMALDHGTNQPIPAPTTGDMDVEHGPKHSVPYRLRDHLRPSAITLQPLLQGIIANLKSGNDNEASVQAALQALAIIANMLDQQELPISDLSFLISTLSKTPKVDHRVWVTEMGKRRKKKAYEYFQQVLERLIHDLPQNIYVKYRQGQRLTPALNLASYNALLHYALHRCRSPDLGNMVLNHMVNERCPSLKPDITTYNTIIRSGTIIRNSNIVEQALSILRRNPKNNLLVLVTAGQPLQDHLLSIEKAGAEGQDAKWIDNIALHDVPTMDSRTLWSYITYLVAIGQPYKAARIFIFLAPKRRIPHRNLHKRNALQKAELEPAVMLGPYALTAILTALYRAGKCGMAERVWIVALAAEKASHDRKYGSRSWTLPVHAYTIMMQCYGAQIRRHGKVVGWARPLRRYTRSGGLLQRSTAAHRLAEMVYERAKSKLHVNASASRLDAKFFRVALKIFARHLKTGRQTRFRRRTYFKRAQLEYAQFGIPSRSGSPIITQVGRDALEAGCEVPAAYQHMLVGHISPAQMQNLPIRTRLYWRSARRCLRPRSPYIPVARSVALVDI
ncbi:hypothetical protein APHAL10511_005599 [Amanita phalloides]|nr:hypothetical protein APHAL10511_005599 [Amanita phalloides]